MKQSVPYRTLAAGLLCWLASFLSLHAQTDVRARIDMDRRYLSYTDEKTLEKSRGFIRQDSTFYIGYMYEGGFLFFRAADKAGFRTCIRSLEKAMTLIEKDYDQQLRTRTNDIYTYLRVSTYQADYTTIAYWLEQSYQNIDRPDKAFEVLSHVRDRNIQYEQGMETYNTMAWIYHRNRTYTAAEFAFLKNSVRANDSMAYLYLDSAILKIHNDAEVNVGIFDASYLNRLAYFTYHYKAILFDHDLEIDSANFYYDILLNSGYYSSNNYAEFQHALGEFRNAEDYFIEAESRDGGSLEKRTKEYFYMRGQIDLYKGKPQAADSLLKKVIDKQGVTPGYGWHAIGYARALHYEGLTNESNKWTDKAGDFEEVHIGTTWGQEQYNLAVATLDYTNQDNFYREYLFENDQSWFWLSPANWYQTTEYRYKLRKLKLELAMLVANNPEREQVIYPLLTSENLITFDEVWTVVDGFGTDYFIRIYEKLLEEDKRPKLKKFFTYFLGRLYLSKGDERKAKDYFEMTLADPEINDPYEVLLYARTCEGMAMLSSKDSDKEYWTREMYNAFPQLVPFSELEMRFHLESKWENTGRNSPIVWVLLVIGFGMAFVLYFLRKYRIVKFSKWFIAGPLLLTVVLACIFYFARQNELENNPAAAVLSQLRDCSVSLDDASSPEIFLSFEKSKDALDITYSVEDEAGEILQQGVLRVSDDQADQAGKLLAYRLFGIKKKMIGQDEEVDTGDQKTKSDSAKKVSPGASSI